MEISPINEMERLQLARQEQVQTQMQLPIQGDEIKMDDKFSTYNDFAQKYPKLNEAVQKTLAQSIMGDLRRHDGRMKEIMREARRQDG